MRITLRHRNDEFLFPERARALRTMPARPPVALVTGVTGFIASELAAQLLRKGWSVRGSVRDTGDARCAALLGLAASLPGSLTLSSADLLADGSFDALVVGCDFVFHVASPFFIDSTDPQVELVAPALAGTINVLGAVAKANKAAAAGSPASRPVQRVVLTSSVAAVHGEYAAPPKNGGPLYAEDDFNCTSTLANGQAYHVSKVRAEEEAWRMAGATGLDLVVICPNFVLGPPLLRGAGGTSVGWARGLVEGEAAPEGTPIVCDVRDVARAHVLAAEVAGASGRYIVSHPGPLAPGTVEAVLRERLPGCVVLPAVEPGAGAVEGEQGADPLRPRIDGSRAAAELGLALRPMRETVADMVTACVVLGLATPREAGK